MPIYESRGIEYEITQGMMNLMEGSASLPCYWSYPKIGGRYPAIALVHDWWGITPQVRRMANFFAQNGYYVIVPDLFGGKQPTTQDEAIAQVKALGDQGYARVNAALVALEQHHHTNSDVAVVGLGIGGSLAYEAAILRPELEAAVACFGFPQRYFGHLKKVKKPVLALYGADDPFISSVDQEQARAELAQSVPAAAHQFHIFPQVGREFLFENNNPADREAGQQAIRLIFDFLRLHLRPPERPTRPLRKN
jgi:carboxymethylenebutenolidase